MSPNENQPPRADPPGRDEGLEAYNTLAETVGGVPSLRWRDNLYQGLAILAALLLGTLIGFLIMGELVGALIGAFVGLVAGLLLSGIVLMVVGWVRAARNVQRWTQKKQS
jgi:predicted lipid-binding transport protein (Tim44 family)